MSSDFKSRFVIPNFNPEDFYNNKKDVVKYSETGESEQVYDTSSDEIANNNEIVSEADDNIEVSVNYDITQIERDLKNRLFEKLDNTPVWFDYERDYQEKLIIDFVSNYMKDNNLEISDIDSTVLIENLTNQTAYFGPIKHLTDNSNVDAVFINSTKNIYIEIGGKILNTETKLSLSEFSYFVKSLKYLSNRDKFTGIDKFETNGYSISVTGDDIVSDGLYITVRKLKEFDTDFIENNTIMPKEVFDFIVGCIDLKKNILIAGDINSYKSLLTDLIIRKCLDNKRSVLLENNRQITADSDSLIKFAVDRKNPNYDDLLSEILKFEPEYIVCDTNCIIPKFIKYKGVISTLRADSIEDAIKESVNEYINSGVAEKSARAKVLKDVDYIVQLNKFADGSVKLTYLVELKSAKTVKESIKTLVKYSSSKYTINIE